MKEEMNRQIGRHNERTVVDFRSYNIFNSKEMEYACNCIKDKKSRFPISLKVQQVCCISIEKMSFFPE